MSSRYDDNGFDARSILAHFSNLIMNYHQGDELVYRAVINRAFLVAYIHLRKTLRNWGPGNVYTFSGTSRDYSKIPTILNRDFRGSFGLSIAPLFIKLRRNRRRADYHYPQQQRRRITRNHAKARLEEAKAIVALSANL